MSHAFAAKCCCLAAALCFLGTNVHAAKKDASLDGVYKGTWAFSPFTVKGTLRIKSQKDKGNAVTITLVGTVSYPGDSFLQPFTAPYSAKFVAAKASGKGKVSLNFNGDWSKGTGKWSNGKLTGTGATVPGPGVTGGDLRKINAKFRKTGRTLHVSAAYFFDSESFPFTINFKK